MAWAAWISDAVGPVVREPDRASAVRSRQRPDIKAPRTGPEPGSDAGLFVVPAPRQCLTRRSERTDTNVRTQGLQNRTPDKVRSTASGENYAMFAPLSPFNAK
ncbi:hypothetical protein CPA62_27860 [Klebsiella pneumoniae]|nr:hypothetical protein CPA62_27860 [Klebsiella pneumoniae]